MKVLTENNGNDLSNAIVIKEITPDTVNNLVNAGFPFGERELHPSLVSRFLQAVKFTPKTTRLVTYHVKEKRAIGFLCLVEDSAMIHSIKFVFTDQRFRKMGIASRMLKYAMLLAKEKGAKKVYLDVEQENIDVINLYKKLGFQILGTRLVGQGYLTEFPRFRVITRSFLGQGYFSRLFYEKRGSLISLRTGLSSSKELLFEVYQRCMDKKLITFFELDANNIMNGYTQSCQPFFFRDILINDLGNSYAFIFNRPFFSNASVEVGSGSNGELTSMMEELFKILQKRGMAYAHITLFNVTDARLLNWFEEKDFKYFKFRLWDEQFDAGNYERVQVSNSYFSNSCKIESFYGFSYFFKCRSKL